MATNECNFKDLKLTDKTSFTYDERILEAQYRDGNAQRAYDGTEHRKTVYNLDFAAMNDTDVQSLKTFYEDVGLVKYFFWCPIGETYTTLELDPNDLRVAWRFVSHIEINPFGSVFSTASAKIESVPNYVTSQTSCPNATGTGDDYYTADPGTWP